MSDPLAKYPVEDAPSLPIAPLSTMTVQQRREESGDSEHERARKMHVLNPWKGPWRPYRGARGVRHHAPRFPGERTEPWVVAEPDPHETRRFALRRLHESVAFLGRAVDQSSTRAVARLLRLAQETKPWFGVRGR